MFVTRAARSYQNKYNEYTQVWDYKRDLWKELVAVISGLPHAMMAPLSCTLNKTELIINDILKQPILKLQC